MKKTITAMIMMFVLISGTSFSQDKQDWKYMHPTPQNNFLGKVRMISETNWVTNGANGVFARTFNSGANWYFHFTAGKVNSATLATSGTTDNWFFDANTGIVVGEQGYIGRTTNGGVTFDTAGTGLSPSNSRNYAIWFANANTGYIGGGAQGAFTTRIFKTTNAGLNWTLVYSELSGSISYLTALGGADANTVCVAWANQSCIRTSDGGVNWTVIPNQFQTPDKNTYNINFLNSTTGFASQTDGSISRTTDAGLSWVVKNTPAIGIGASMYSTTIVSATEIYAVGDPYNLYKTTDLGDTWITLPISVSGPATTFVWRTMDHSGSTYTLSGDYGIIAKSTDGCATWTAPGYTQLSTALRYDITNVPGTSKYWSVGRADPFGSSTKQIFYSSDGGSNWSTQNAGVVADFTSISMINENTGYISGTNNKVMKTTDGGVSWFAKTSPSPVATSQLYTCDFIDENTGWVFVNFSTVAGGNIFKTTNGGDNWAQYTTGTSSENIYSAEMVDANTGFCTMNSSSKPVFRTTNGGVNWTGATITGFTGGFRGVTSTDGNTVYICQSSGTSRVAKSTNGGVNWTLITLPAAVDANSMDFKDNNTGYVSGNTSGIICRTSNGGANWTFQNTHQITGIKVFVSQGDTAWNVGGNGAILRYTGVSIPVSMNLTVSMEAMYNTGTSQLARKDTVKVYLRNTTAPYAIMDSATGTIDSVSLTGNFIFPNTPSGSYYIVVKHFNSIETWSKTGGETIKADGSVFNYDFTSAANKAYGNNQIQIGTEWSTYSGDVNQDGIIDLSDLLDIFNDASNFVGGSYVVTDLNADNIVTLADLLYAYNNSANFVILSRP